MAKGGAKKQVQENQARLAMLQNLLLFSNAWFVVGRLGFFYRSTTLSTWFVGVLMTVIQAFCFTALKRMAEPLVDQGGQIVDGGVDLLHASIASYYQDLVYLTAFMQVACVATSKAFWAFWLVPAVGGWMLWTNVIQPYLSQRNAPQALQQETEAERKRREKAERKGGRPKLRQVR